VPLACIDLIQHIKSTGFNIKNFFKVQANSVNPKLSVKEFKEALKTNNYVTDDMDELMGPLYFDSKNDSISLGKL
jgi:hypothetical protein